MPVPVTISVNGRAVSDTVEPRVTLVDFLRDRLGLTGTHVGCEQGVCGACSVLLDGVPVRSCLLFAVQAGNRSVTTVEGLDDAILLDAFEETHAMQCGYCTPGMLIAARGLLSDTPDPSEDDIREAISGTLCRCTGYVQIVEAIALAATRLRQDERHG
ncbi:MAG: (2Fe-2S)-binding protein [Alphaproteobacteria bacterium]|nr:(2Fe-2S)-binding protein [Alphaproteobacteria bacterium]